MTLQHKFANAIGNYYTVCVKELAALFFVLACLTQLDVDSAVCASSCRWKGYQSGSALGAQCQCIDYFPMAEITKRKLVLPKKLWKSSHNESAPATDQDYARDTHSWDD